MVSERKTVTQQTTTQQTFFEPTTNVLVGVEAPDLSPIENLVNRLSDVQSETLRSIVQADIIKETIRSTAKAAEAKLELEKASLELQAKGETSRELNKALVLSSGIIAGALILK